MAGGAVSQALCLIQSHLTCIALCSALGQCIGCKLDTCPQTRPIWCVCVCASPLASRDYTTWREEGGKLPDGRHYKNFLIVDDRTGHERLVITAEDSHRRDR